MKTVVIVDDDSNSVELNSIYSHKVIGECVIVEFYSAKKALEYINSNDIDILITDHDMPEITGDYLSHIAKKRNKKTKTILISSNAYLKINHSFDLQLLKPLHFEDFKRELLILLSI